MSNPLRLEALLTNVSEPRLVTDRSAALKVELFIPIGLGNADALRHAMMNARSVTIEFAEQPAPTLTREALASARLDGETYCLPEQPAPTETDISGPPPHPNPASCTCARCIAWCGGGLREARIEPRETAPDAQRMGAIFARDWNKAR